MNKFKSGIEKIIEQNPVQVVPIALQGLWGSFFSHKDGSAFSTLPKRFWSRVTIVADEAIAPDQAKVEILERKVKQLIEDVR